MIAAGSGGEWATQSQAAAWGAVDKLELPAIPDDALVDLVGCLIDEIERLRALLDGYEALEKSMKQEAERERVRELDNEKETNNADA